MTKEKESEEPPVSALKVNRQNSYGATSFFLSDCSPRTTRPGHKLGTTNIDKTPTHANRVGHQQQSLEKVSDKDFYSSKTSSDSEFSYDPEDGNKEGGEVKEGSTD